METILDMIKKTNPYNVIIIRKYRNTCYKIILANSLRSRVSQIGFIIPTEIFYHSIVSITITKY